MGYGYYNYYTNPISNFTNIYVILAVAVILAVILGVVLFCTFMKKNNEGRFTGLKGKIYNALTFNRFYAENIIKFLYVIAACVITVIGLVYMVLVSFLAGACILLAGNVVLRIGMELVLMFIILCKKTVSIDKRLSGIEAFYGDQYGDEDEWTCDGCCDDCGDQCSDECSNAEYGETFETDEMENNSGSITEI